MSSLVFLALNASYAPFAFKNLDLNRLLLPRGIDHLILDSENIEYFLMGDLNCDMIATLYDNNTCKLMSITNIYGLQQLITEEPTTRCSKRMFLILSVNQTAEIN